MKINIIETSNKFISEEKNLNKKIKVLNKYTLEFHNKVENKSITKILSQNVIIISKGSYGYNSFIKIDYKGIVFAPSRCSDNYLEFILDFLNAVKENKPEKILQLIEISSHPNDLINLKNRFSKIIGVPLITDIIKLNEKLITLEKENKDLQKKMKKIKKIISK